MYSITTTQLQHKLPEVTQNGKIDLVKLAANLGLKVYLVDKNTDLFNARISYNDQQDLFEILVNKKHSYTRQRFSIAHEIAHFVLHKEEIMRLKSLDRVSTKNMYNYKMEKEADLLSEQILMPEGLVEKFMDQITVDKEQDVIYSDTIRQVAEQFEVSPMVASIRLQNLHYNVSLTYAA